MSNAIDGSGKKRTENGPMVVIGVLDKSRFCDVMGTEAQLEWI